MVYLEKFVSFTINTFCGRSSMVVCAVFGLQLSFFGVSHLSVYSILFAIITPTKNQDLNNESKYLNFQMVYFDF
jgi:hypothetical protein